MCLESQKFQTINTEQPYLLFLLKDAISLMNAKRFAIATFFGVLILSNAAIFFTEGAHWKNLIVTICSIYFAGLCALDVWLFIAIIVPNVRSGKMVFSAILAVATYLGVIIWNVIQIIFDMVNWEPPLAAFIYIPLYALVCAIGAWFLPRGIVRVTNRLFK